MKKAFIITITVVFSFLLMIQVIAEEKGSSADGEWISLFDGKSLQGWVQFLPDPNADPAKTWMVKDGVIHCTGEPTGYIRTDKKFSNYELQLEWRWAGKPGNSGVLLHVQDKDEVWPKSIEAQLMHENAGDIWVIGGTDFEEHKDKNERRVPKLAESSEKKVGEWNQYDIWCEGDAIRVLVNGVLQNKATHCTVKEGYIGLQSEGAPIEFRNIRLRKLEPQK
ncbi:MAG TPA: DUF1080 domain-containing protein [Candidatus Hydrogenedens sp.]|nr:DUF1080 domain-containing protein [Candidatus Hydrogenedens sp.]